MKNFVIPKNELKTIESDLQSTLDYLENDSQIDSEPSDDFEFPFFFALEALTIRRYFNFNNLDITKYFVIDSESLDEDATPEIHKYIYSLDYGDFSEDKKNPPLFKFSTFNAFVTYFETIINKKKALVVFKGDGCSGTSFSLTELIFSK